MKTCSECQRELRVGETVSASDWKVIRHDGVIYTEVRYTCDDCEAAA